jgi:hypothetical protein
LGFTATSDISSTTIVLVAALFLPHIRFESSWGVYNTLLEKYKQGFRFANLGGFETEGTYRFYRGTFRPIEELQRTHLVYPFEKISQDKPLRNQINPYLFA